MKVILLDNIRGVGQVGDVKDVSDGYGRNFLFPRSLARPATAGAVKDAEALKAKRLAARSLELEQAQAVAAKLAGAVIEMTGKANAKGTLFAAIEPEQVAERLSTLAGARIEASAVRLAEPLKTLGDHTVTVHLTDEVSASVTVKISAPAK